ncbi:MAG TPA: M43 family zinc metalloprotease [Hymenobacter sp.]|jgi:PKD repeat protein
MLKKLYPSVLTAALALTGLVASAQTIPAGRNRQWCGFEAEQERYFSANPAARAAQKAVEARLAAMPAQQRGTAYVTDVTIPVVVHVIHKGGADNISDRQIASALALLNADYQKLNPDTATTSPLFQPIAASIGFQFRLARIDPNGNATTGITRHYEPGLVNDTGNGAVHAVSNWDRSRYLNIWVVNSINLTGSGTTGTILGYVSTGGPTNPRDGFTVRQDFFGDIGTSSLARAELRTGTHEIGHYFGLSHPWGGNNNPGTGDCAGTDNVADTPSTDGTFNCDLSYAPCGVVANVQNFMDYAACPTMFTQGQRTRMRNVLATVRPGLTTAANLVATGTNDGYVAPEPRPIAAFGVAPGTSANVCINTAVSLRDFSSNFTASGGTLTYSWSFPGGSPATATGQAVSVSYPTAGIYSVTETVSNNAGSSTATKTNLIRVEGPTGGETAPFAQSFENSAFPNIFSVPSLRNYDLSGATSTGGSATNRWLQQTAVPAADGMGYLVVNNRLYPAGAVTTLITPNINLANASSAALSFSRAYALRTAASNDQLRVAFSSDCGVNWTTSSVLDVTALSTRGLTPLDGYVPATSAEWQTLTVPIPPQFQGSGLFKVRLQFFNGSTPGNNFFLDNLRISSPLATQAEALASRGISVYPNPMTLATAVHLSLTATTQVQVSLTDLLGRNVLTLPAKTYGAGQQTVPLQAGGQTLRAGIYVVRISLNGETYSSKLTIE